MLKNFIKLAWRNLRKNRLHSFINISGLSVGLAVAILIGLFIWNQLSFDKATPGYERIARVQQTVDFNGEKKMWDNVPIKLSEALRAGYGSDFEQVAMCSGNQSHFMTIGDKKFSQTGNYFEPSINDLLSLKMIAGKRSFFQDPYAIFLSQSSALALFGNKDPMNQVIRMDNKFDVKVEGIYADFPDNSSFAGLQYMAPWAQNLLNNPGLLTQSNPWRSNSYTVYVKLAPGSSMASVSKRIRDIKMKNVRPEERRMHPQLFLQPMEKWHLYSEFKNGVNTGGAIQYVWLFGIIGAFVLLLACINFMNLSTARSQKRAREVGIRKTLGSMRIQLVRQFFTESLMVTAISLLFALLLVELALPTFNDLAQTSILVPWSNVFFWICLLVFVIITGLLAGSYPALYLSSFQPVKVLKGVFQAGRFAAVPRKVLVTLQFSVSIILIIGTIVVFRQIQFAKSRPIGYDRNGVVMIPQLTEDIHDHFEAVRHDLLQSGSITEMAESNSPTTGVWSTNSQFNWQGKDPGLPVDFPNIAVSTDYGKVVGWQFIDGRDFSREFVADTDAFVINETAARFMHLKNPVGQIVTWDNHPYTVVGIIKDMLMESPYEPVRPTVYHVETSAQFFTMVRINPAADPHKAIRNIEAVITKYSPAAPFSYTFGDESYAYKFGYEERIGKLAGFFAILAIFISCLGLFGMASFMAEQRIKEIGIRKVLGASMTSLWALLSRDFATLILLSVAIAVPLGYYFMQNWLSQYAFHSDLSWWIFVVAGAGALLITLATVSYQAIRAALINPAESLKSE